MGQTASLSLEVETKLALGKLDRTGIRPKGRCDGTLRVCISDIVACSGAWSCTSVTMSHPRQTRSQSRKAEIMEACQGFKVPAIIATAYLPPYPRALTLISSAAKTCRQHPSEHKG